MFYCLDIRMLIVEIGLGYNVWFLKKKKINRDFCFDMDLWIKIVIY